MVITAIAAAVFIVLLIFLYNSLVRRKNQVATAYSTIDVLLKKRFDLIPNLIKAVQRYMRHEAGVLADITAMRAKAVSGQISDAETVDLDRKATQTIGRIMVAAENYPDLKASRNFADLQASLNEVEEQISAARRAYNASALEYNNALEMFPSNIMAGLMRYQKKVFFEITGSERANVDVSVLFNA
jgi:LemA protein